MTHFPPSDEQVDQRQHFLSVDPGYPGGYISHVAPKSDIAPLTMRTTSLVLGLLSTYLAAVYAQLDSDVDQSFDSEVDEPSEIPEQSPLVDIFGTTTHNGPVPTVESTTERVFGTLPQRIALPGPGMVEAGDGQSPVGATTSSDGPTSAAPVVPAIAAHTAAPSGVPGENAPLATGAPAASVFYATWVPTKSGPYETGVSGQNTPYGSPVETMSQATGTSGEICPSGSYYPSQSCSSQSYYSSQSCPYESSYPSECVSSESSYASSETSYPPSSSYSSETSYPPSSSYSSETSYPSSSSYFSETSYFTSATYASSPPAASGTVPASPLATFRGAATQALPNWTMGIVGALCALAWAI
jgi:hypothetical protein